MSIRGGLALAEKGLIPLPGLRLGIRRLLRQRLDSGRIALESDKFIRTLPASPLAIEVDRANDQHYEVPAEFFELVLGKHMKYSSGHWPKGTNGLDQAEHQMLELSCERAEVEDGQRVLELGCGWGSMTLHLARKYPHARITAVSNSVAQRRFIRVRAPPNVEVITADMNDFDTGERFDRVVSIEMFEHMRNHEELLRRIARWLHPSGILFVHLFCHRRYAYPFETEGDHNWMGRYFFTGGMMPSLDLLSRFDRDLTVDATWELNGKHYGRTAGAWRRNLESHRSQVLRVFEDPYGDEAEKWYHRWRLFFLSCEELFSFRDGREWMLGHYRLRRT